MEEGSMRIDANVSVRKAGAPFGTRCEIKNLNSLRSLQRAIDYEALRQTEVLDEGGTIRQETRHWDENRGETSTMRTKEEAEDYRYFREPDLVELDPDQAWQDRVRAALPPMPAARRARLEGLVSDLSDAQRDAIGTVVELDLDHFVIAASEAKADVSVALARSANEIAAGIEHVDKLSVENFVTTVAMEQKGELSATQAKKVLGVLLESGGDPGAIAKSLGFEQLGEGALGELVATCIEENPSEWARYREGDEKLSQFFIGLIMKLTKGQANGKAVIAELQRRK
jgi:aspartyl-tRNA(Asn)/glutamyl-tRNA(Gln) amidotransferase subunit B